MNAYKKRKWQIALNDHPKKIYPVFVKRDFKNILGEIIKL